MGGEPSTTPPGSPPRAQDDCCTDIFKGRPAEPLSPTTVEAHKLAESLMKQLSIQQPVNLSSGAYEYTSLNDDNEFEPGLIDPIDLSSSQETGAVSNKQRKLIDSLMEHFEELDDPIVFSAGYSALVTRDWNLAAAVTHLETTKAEKTGVLHQALWEHYYRTTPGFISAEVPVIDSTGQITFPTPSHEDLKHIYDTCKVTDPRLCLALWHICAGSSAFAAAFYPVAHAQIWVLLQPDEAGHVETTLIRNELKEFARVVWDEMGGIDSEQDWADWVNAMPYLGDP